MSSAPSTTPQPPAGGPPAAPPTTGGGGKALLWIFGGCATIVVVGIVVVAGIFFFVVHKVKQAGLDPELMQKNPVLAVAKLSVATNPDLETVSSDDSSGTIVVRDKKTGKVSTMKVDPVKKTMVVTDENGKTVTMRLDPARNTLVVTDDQGKTATISANAQAGSLEVKSSDGNFKMGAGADKAPDWVPVYPRSNPQSNLSASDAKGEGGGYSFVTKDAVDKVLSYYGEGLKSAGLKVSNTTTNANGKISGIVSGSSDGDKRSVMVTASGEDDGTHVGVVYGNKKQN
jgi:hypothetical protein